MQRIYREIAAGESNNELSLLVDTSSCSHLGNLLGDQFNPISQVLSEILSGNILRFAVAWACVTYRVRSSELVVVSLYLPVLYMAFSVSTHRRGYIYLRDEPRV